MGASLDTPAVCPICHDAYRDPVTLKCKHSFCQRCIGELWSDSPNGPYYCPEFRCKTEYKTLPFRRNGTSSTSGHRPQANSPGQSILVNTAQWTLGRPSLSSRLLGKRKASAALPEQQPDTKRAAPASGSEEPSTSSSATTTQPPNAPSPQTEERPDLAQRDSDNLSVSDSSSYVTLMNDTFQDVPAQQERPGSEEAARTNNSDESRGVDTCDAPTPSTSWNDTSQTTPNRPPAASPARKEKSPLQRFSWPPPDTAQSPAATPSTSKGTARSVRPEASSAGPVSCHYCPSVGQQPAVKTCLVCGASMCAEHLRPHLDSLVFRSHALVPAVEDISPWRCQDHQEMNRIYCRQCAVSVCTVCTVIGSHRDHTCISIREAEKEMRGNLKDEIKRLQEVEQRLMTRVTELKQKKQAFQVVLDDAQAAVQQQYGAMREALEQEEQTALQCVAQEESRVMRSVEQQLDQVQDSLSSIQQGLNTLEGLADAKEDRRVQEQAFIMEYSKTSKIVGETRSSAEEPEPPEEVDQARLTCLRTWTEKRLDTVVISLPDRDPYRLLYGTIPFLDVDTAHPRLVLSEDNRKATYSHTLQAYPEHGARFSAFPQVLASRALEGGRWYWEVSVPPDEGQWKVGLCEDQIGRKGQKDSCRLGFNPHSWCLGGEKGKVEAVHDKVAVPVATERLQTVGVFLDFDQGSVSFYNVSPGGSLTLLHCFQHRFTEPLYPALSVSKTHLTICDLFQSSSAE